MAMTASSAASIGRRARRWMGWAGSLLTAAGAGARARISLPEPTHDFCAGCIADDYTGASDVANTLAKQGLRTVQTIGIPAGDVDLPETDAVVVSLKIRSVAASDAVARSRAASAWLHERGAGHVMYKICSTFNSTDAGNIGPVLDALRADAGETAVLVTPAFPETGRTVYQGNLFVGAVPLNESPLKDHPLNPMRDANLVRVLARQSASGVGLIDLATVSHGANAIRDKLAQLSSDNVGSAIADAEFERNLEAIGGAALGQRLSVGASGLGLGLARGLIAAGAARHHERPPSGRTDRWSGSVPRRKLLAGHAGSDARAEQTMPVLRLDPEKLVDGHGETQRALDWAAQQMARGPGPYRQQRTAGCGFQAPGPPRTGGCRPCHRASACDDCRGPGRTRRAQAGHCGWGDLSRGRRSARHPGIRVGS